MRAQQGIRESLAFKQSTWVKATDKLESGVPENHKMDLQVTQFNINFSTIVTNLAGSKSKTVAILCAVPWGLVCYIRSKGRACSAHGHQALIQLKLTQVKAD